MNEPTPHDPRQFRDVLGTFLTGVTVVTTRDADGMAHGVTANSFSSVSLDPPLVLWSQAYTSKSFVAFRDSDHFAINILAHDQIPLSNHFAKSTENKFAEITHRNGLGGAPILDGAVAHLECVKHAAYPAGDHVIYIGRVERYASSLRRPLAFGGGKYMLARGHEFETSHGIPAAPVSPAEIARVAEAMPSVSKRMGGLPLALAVWGNHGPTIVHWQPGSGSADLTEAPMLTGEVVSLTSSAAGLVFAAFAPATTKPWLEEDLRLHPETGRLAATDDLATRRANLESQLARIREAGCAMAGNQAAVPIPAADEGPRMALAVIGLVTPEALIEAVRELG